jgi:tyrosine-protein phosphatase YwqE
VLIDFWGDTLPPGFAEAVQYLQSLGLTVIMAHPERIAAFQNDPHVWKEVADLGCRFQGNLQCFSDVPGSPPRELVEKHALDGTYWLFGTDTHWPETLDLRLDGLTTAINVLGEKLVDRLTRENPRELLA